MPWVILAAALCVLVWFWPRNTLIGLAVVGTAGVLAGIAFWGYGVYDERQRELVAITVEPAAEAASRTSPGIACGEGELLVSITNGSGKTVTGVRFNVTCNNINTAPLCRMCGFQHGIGFAYACGISEKYL